MDHSQIRTSLKSGALIYNLKSQLSDNHKRYTLTHTETQMRTSFCTITALVAASTILLDDSMAYKFDPLLLAENHSISDTIANLNTILPAASREADDVADANRNKAAKAASNERRAAAVGMGTDTVTIGKGPIRTPTTVKGWVALGVPEDEARKHVAK